MVSGGLDYEAVVPGISTPGSYFAGVSVIGLSSGGLPGVAVLGETPFSVVGSANTALLPTFLAPPSQFGCHSATSVGKNKPRWTKVACLSKAQVAQLPPPIEGGNGGLGIFGLQMQKHNLGGAIINVTLTKFNGEADTTWESSGFSIQANTNKFSGNNGHTDWVQFVLQNYLTIAGAPLCVWEIDITTGDYDTNTVCAFIPFSILNPNFSAEIEGIALPEGNTILQDGVPGLVVQYISTAMPGVWYSVVAPDHFGLTSSAVAGCGGCWTSVDGTIIGVGSASQAVFTPPTRETTWLYGQYNSPGANPSQIELLTGSAVASLIRTTGETNNLDYINPRPFLYCSAWAGGSCTLTTNSGN